MQIIDGIKISEQIKQQLKQEVKQIKEQTNLVPGLAIVLVGADPASKIYVNKKIKTATDLGFQATLFSFSETEPESKVIIQIQKLNKDPLYSGIIVQLPLPKGFDKFAILDAVAKEKDVDGFGLVSQGLLFEGRAGFLPATARGVLELIESTNTEIKGKNCVVVGRSLIVGQPVAKILQDRNATVTVCHSHTKNLEFFTRNADILVVAVGIPNFIKGSMVKVNSVVIDVGINKVDGKIVGDVEFSSVAKVASHLTPVPGGVGPLTVVSLLKNTLDAFKKINKLKLKNSQPHPLYKS